MKLRRRTLGPLLEASGWAINGQVKINFLLGKLLTSKAELPKNAKRNLRDPLKTQNKKSMMILLCAIVFGIGITAGWLWYQGDFQRYFEQPQAQSTQNGQQEENNHYR